MGGNPTVPRPLCVGCPAFTAARAPGAGTHPNDCLCLGDDRGCGIWKGLDPMRCTGWLGNCVYKTSPKRQCSQDSNCISGHACIHSLESSKCVAKAPPGFVNDATQCRRLVDNLAIDSLRDKPVTMGLTLRMSSIGSGGQSGVYAQVSWGVQYVDSEGPARM